MTWPFPARHIGGASPGTAEGVTRIRVPNPTMANPSGSVDRLGGQQLLGQPDDGHHGPPGDAHDAQSHHHQHQSDTRADTTDPEPEPRAHVFPARPAEVLFERV